VDLINEEDDLSIGALYFFDDGLDPFFKFAFELGSCNQGGDIKDIDLLGEQIFGHVLLDDPPGYPFDDGCFSYTGITDEDGVVLFAAGEDVQDAADLLIAADDRIEFAIEGSLVEMDTKFLEGRCIGSLYSGRSLFFLRGVP
jgi:hypothetical protein